MQGELVVSDVSQAVDLRSPLTVSARACNPQLTMYACPTWRAVLMQGELVVIDVSQAVDLDHPKALDFLREDCAHVNDYFRCGVVGLIAWGVLLVIKHSVGLRVQPQLLRLLEALASAHPLSNHDSARLC